MCSGSLRLSYAGTSPTPATPAPALSLCHKPNASVHHVLACQKPPFAASAKGISRAVTVEYSPNAQCYTSNSGGAYWMYNAVAKSVVPTGIPSTVGYDLDIEIEGCPYPPLDVPGPGPGFDAQGVWVGGRGEPWSKDENVKLRESS